MRLHRSRQTLCCSRCLSLRYSSCPWDERRNLAYALCLVQVACKRDYRSPPKRLLTIASVTFASIYRATTIARSASDPDPTWGPVPATIWSVVEANTGIICACLPMLRGPFVRLFGPLLGAHRTTTTPRSYQLSGRSERPHVSSAAQDVRHDIYDSRSDSDRDSEEGIFKNDTMPDGKRGPNTRRGSGIIITNEFSVVTNEIEKRKSQARSEGHDGDTLTTRSVTEDRPDGKSPYFHI